MVIEICIGSSCHLKGSYAIVQLFNKAILENNLENKVLLKGAFCFGKCCDEGVNVRFDGKEIVSVNEQNFNEIFNTYVLERL